MFWLPNANYINTCGGTLYFFSKDNSLSTFKYREGRSTLNQKSSIYFVYDCGYIQNHGKISFHVHERLAWNDWNPTISKSWCKNSHVDKLEQDKFTSCKPTNSLGVFFVTFLTDLIACETKHCVFVTEVRDIHMNEIKLLLGNA